METRDERITRDVIDQLHWDSTVDASDIKVKVSNGHVKLTGTVPSLVARRAAQMAASMVPGVISVSNQLEVSLSSVAQAANDEEVRLRVITVLQWDMGADSDSIIVDVEGGSVTLEGSVDAYWKKVRAEELVSRVTGVLKVINGLAVVPSKSLSDESIAEDIMQDIELNSGVDVNKVDVRVENGVVTLSGVVPTWGMYFAVEDTARYTPGVVDVANRLEVE